MRLIPLADSSSCSCVESLLNPQFQILRLTLLLITTTQLVTFLTLHILNLTTPLAPAAALQRHASYFIPASATVATAVPTAEEYTALHHHVDMDSPAVSAALSSLSSSHSAGADIITRVSAPVFVRVVPSVDTSSEVERLRTSTHLVMLDSFMHAWSSLIGDPIVSKWIVITLAVSVFLNWYLLKGLASSLPSPFPSMVTFPSPAVTVSAESAPKMPRRWSGVGAADLASYQRERNAEAQNQGIKLHRPTPLAVDIPESSRFPRSYGTKKRHDEEDDEREEEEEVEEPASRGSPSQSEISSATGPQTPPPMYAGGPDQHPAVIRGSPQLAGNTGINVAQRLEAMVREVLPASSNGIVPASPSIQLTSSSDIAIGRRPLKELLELYAENPANVKQMSDEEVILLSQEGKIQAYALEKVLGDFERAVRIRRALICKFELGL